MRLGRCAARVKNLTHWSVFRRRESLGLDNGQIDSTGRKTALAAALAARDAIEPVKALQQSGNSGEVPFAALRCSYSLPVQLVRNGLDGDKARSSKLTNCRAKDLSSCVRGPLVHQFIVDPVLFRIQAPKHPHHSGAMPPAASGSWYPPSVQLFRQRPACYEASRHNLPKCRDQIESAGICGVLVRNCTVYRRSARRSFVTRLVHFAIMAGIDGWLRVKNVSRWRLLVRFVRNQTARLADVRRSRHHNDGAGGTKIGRLLVAMSEFANLGESAATISRAVEHGWVILRDVQGKPLDRKAVLTDEGRRLARKGR